MAMNSWFGIQVCKSKVYSLNCLIYKKKQVMQTLFSFSSKTPTSQQKPQTNKPTKISPQSSRAEKPETKI